MAVTVADVEILTQSSTATAATITLAGDFDVVSGDVLLFFVIRPSTTNLITAPGDLSVFRALENQVATNVISTGIYYRIADGSEQGNSYSFTIGSLRRACITCLCIRGADTATIATWPVGSPFTAGNLAGTSRTLPSVDTTGFDDNCLIIAALNHAGTINGKVHTPPEGGDSWVEHSDHVTLNGSADAGQSVASMTQATAGSFASRIWTVDQGGGGYVGYSIGIPEGGITVPGAPTGVSAVALNQAATVSFSTPSTDGGSAITGYTTTSTPGSITTSGASSPLTVNGLTNGTSYTFTVHATNANGNSAESSASNSVIPSGPLVWSGSAWVPATRKTWNGTSWEEV